MPEVLKRKLGDLTVQRETDQDIAINAVTPAKTGFRDDARGCSRDIPIEILDSDEEDDASPVLYTLRRVQKRTQCIDLGLIDLTLTEERNTHELNRSPVGKAADKAGAGDKRQDDRKETSEFSARKLRGLNHATKQEVKLRPNKTIATVKSLMNEILTVPDLPPVAIARSLNKKLKTGHEPTGRPEEVEQPHCKPEHLPIELDNRLIQLTNPKAEIKKEYLLHNADVLELVAPAALAPFPIRLAEPLRSTTVTREQLSRRFGGNTMDTFPARRKTLARAAAAGGAFMCINLLWNPHGPQRPGHGGLFFETTVWPGDPWTATATHSRTQVLFVRLARAKWLYLGEYELSAAKALSVGQWRGLHPSARAVWVENIGKKKWGIPIRARIHLRRELGREPTRHEVENAAGEFKEVTSEQIAAALHSGQESIQVWSMVCIGYDENFQLQLIELSRNS